MGHWKNGANAQHQNLLSIYMQDSNGDQDNQTEFQYQDYRTQKKLQIEALRERYCDGKDTSRRD